MEPSLLKLAETLDGWSDGGRVTLTEIDVSISIYGLSASDATELLAICRALDWATVIEDASGGEASPGYLAADFQPFLVVATKPDGVAGLDRLVTNTCLASRLAHGPPQTVYRVVRCTEPFETSVSRFTPFGDNTGFKAAPRAAKPRRVVREIGTHRIVAEDIGAWLLLDTARMPWADPVFRVWVSLATTHVMRALANEVEPDSLVFRGPPLVRLQMQPAQDIRLDVIEFRALQNAASWVYDNERELEMRHGLYAAEIARTSAFGSDAESVFRQAAAPALESAKIAYGLNLSQVSRDTLKALADLRKAISDETGKLADTTRSIAGAVATALFAGIGLLVTRSTTNIPGILMIGLSVILALYVGAVIWSGCRFISVQADIRVQWRSRLYAFLPNAEYKAMVEDPAHRAEGAFYLAAILGGIISALLVAGVTTYVSLSTAKPPAQTTSSVTKSSTPGNHDVASPAPTPPASVRADPAASAAPH